MGLEPVETASIPTLGSTGLLAGTGHYLTPRVVSGDKPLRAAQLSEDTAFPEGGSILNYESFLRGEDTPDALDDILTHLEGGEGADRTVILGPCKGLKRGQDELPHCGDGLTGDRAGIHQGAPTPRVSLVGMRPDSARGETQHKIFNEELFQDNNPVVPGEFIRPKRPAFRNSADIRVGRKMDRSGEFILIDTDIPSTDCAMPGESSVACDDTVVPSDDHPPQD